MHIKRLHPRLLPRKLEEGGERKLVSQSINIKSKIEERLCRRIEYPGVENRAQEE
jgi:hypothetical protein